MKWQGRRRSANVKDRRGRRGGAVTGISGLGLVIVLLFALMGGDPTQLLGTVGNEPYVETGRDEELAEFVSVVLADTEDVWTRIFEKNGMVYEKPALVLYSGSVESACGTATSAVGPFYCPGDRQLYIDLSFYEELHSQFQAPGDFAMAYVVAHEVGHHVQTLLGTSQKVHALRNQLTQEEYNKYLVKLELQADYYAGVWAHYAQGMDVLEEGDLDEALTAASAVGDDAIQKRSQGYAVPDSFTHGTSEQRKRWFYRGFQSGNLENGDTFEEENL